VRGNSCAAHPKAAESAIRSGNENSLLCKCRSVISKQPAVVRTVIAMGGESNVNFSIQEQHPRATVLRQSKLAENQLIAIRTWDAAIASAADGRVDDHRPGRFLNAGGDVDSVQPVNEGAILFGL